MDIEGAEKFALRGMDRSLETVRMVQEEVHDGESFKILGEKLQGFSISERNGKEMWSVFAYVLKHPIWTLRLDTQNNFLTPILILKNGERRQTAEFPKYQGLTTSLLEFSKKLRGDDLVRICSL